MPSVDLGVPDFVANKYYVVPTYVTLLQKMFLFSFSLTRPIVSDEQNISFT